MMIRQLFHVKNECKSVNIIWFSQYFQLLYDCQYSSVHHISWFSFLWMLSFLLSIMFEFLQPFHKDKIKLGTFIAMLEKVYKMVPSAAISGCVLKWFTHYHAKLKLPDKGRTIKGLAVCYEVWLGSMKGMGLRTYTRCVGLVPCCGQNSHHSPVPQHPIEII